MEDTYMAETYVLPSELKIQNQGSKKYEKPIKKSECGILKESNS